MKKSLRADRPIDGGDDVKIPRFLSGNCVMSDSNQDHDRDPRFSRALLGRILAVCLFVALGTFAVIQMMNSTEKNSLEPSVVEGEQPAAVATDESKFAANPPPPSKSSSTFDTTGDPPSAPPSRSTVNDTAFNPNPSQANFKPTPSPSRSNIAQGPIQATSVASAKPSIPPYNSPSQPPVRSDSNGPPMRYAMRPNGGVPLIGSDNGFEARPAALPANATPNLPGTAEPPKPLVKSTIAAAIDKTADTANQFGTDLKTSAGNLVSDAKQNVDSTMGKLSDSIPTIEVNKNAFGAPLSPVQSNPVQSNLAQSNLAQSNSAQSSPAKSFEPPSSAPRQPMVNKSFDPGDLPTDAPEGGPVNPPTMKAPIPSPSGFAGNSGLRPMNNGFGDRPIAPTNSPTQLPSQLQNSQPLESSSGGSREQSFPINAAGNLARPAPKEDSNRLSGINQTGSAPTVQSKADFSASASPNGTTPGTSFPPPRNSIGINNTSSGNVEVGNPHTSNVPGDRQLEGVQAPALTVEKLSPREIQVNQAAEFEIVVRNVGRVNAEDVQVHDQIPAGTEFQGASPEPSPVAADRRLKWEIGSLKAGQEKRIKFQLKPIQPGEIGSVAHVTFATQASMRTLVTKPVLEITHQTKPKVLIGSDVILDVVVTNKGDGAARDILIQEDVPQQLEYQGGYRELEYPIGTLLPGQSKRIQLGLKAAEIGRLKNLIFASAAGGLRTQHELELEVVAPRLTTASDGPTRRFLQREVKHRFKVGNQGTAPATNVDLIAHLPAGLRFVSADNQGKYSAGAHAVFWSIAELGMEVDATVELVTMPVEVGSQNIKFEAVADLNQKSGLQQELNVEHLIDVFFDIDDVVDPIEIGADTSYRIRVVNQGTQAATNVQLQIEFPTGLVPTGVEGSLQNQIQGQAIVFSPISSLKPGDQLDLLVRAKGQSAGDHRVVVKMQADGRQTLVSKEETTRVYADR